MTTTRRLVVAPTFGHERAPALFRAPGSSGMKLQDAVTPPLSLFIIAKDEADRLPAVLDAASGLAREIIVVDSGSEDGTPAIAESKGAKVIRSVPFPGYGEQKRIGEEASSQPWLLNLDADEIITPELREEIRALFAHGEPPCDAYHIDIVEVLPDEEAPRSFAYRLSPVRLYKRGRGHFSTALVHDRIIMTPGARVGKLSGVAHHRSIRSLPAQLKKLDAYSTLQAIDFVDRGRRIHVTRLFVEFPVAFLKAYFGRRWFLRGSYGFLLAMNHAIFRHLRIMKIYELQRTKTK